MGNLVFGSAERPGNSADAAEIPVVIEIMTLPSGKEPDLPKDPKRPRRRHVTVSTGTGTGTCNKVLVAKKKIFLCC